MIKVAPKRCHVCKGRGVVPKLGWMGEKDCHHCDGIGYLTQDNDDPHTQANQANTQKPQKRKYTKRKLFVGDDEAYD